MKIKVYSKKTKQSSYFSLEGFREFTLIWENNNQEKANKLYNNIVNGGKLENEGGIITSCDWMVNNHNGMLEALCFEAELSELGVERADFFFRLRAHSDSSHDGRDSHDWLLSFDQIGSVLSCD